MSFGRRRTSRAEQILLARAATREPLWQGFFPGVCSAATAGQSSISLNMTPSGWQQCCEAYLLSWDIIRSPVTCRQAVHALTTAMPLHSALSELMAVHSLHEHSRHTAHCSGCAASAAGTKTATGEAVPLQPALQTQSPDRAEERGRSRTRRDRRRGSDNLRSPLYSGDNALDSRETSALHSREAMADSDRCTSPVACLKQFPLPVASCSSSLLLVWHAGWWPARQALDLLLPPALLLRPSMGQNAIHISRPHLALPDCHLQRPKS